MSDDDRALVGQRHRTPARGVPVEVDDFERPITGVLEGEALIAAREARAAENPAQRIALIETEQKAQALRLSRIEIATVEIRGDQKATNVSLAGIERTLERMAQREHVTFTARVDVDKAERLDTIDARKDRRKFWFQIGAAVLGGGVIGKLLHWLGVF